MLSFDFPQKCTTCQGYKTIPYSWNSTAKPQMCTCPKPVSLLGTLAWECPRCKKINAPWKASCDCTPTPFSAPTSGNTQPYIGPANPFLGYFPDPPGPRPSSHDLNKNFTDK